VDNSPSIARKEQGLRGRVTVEARIVSYVGRGLRSS
jgi:hypothetical protein